MTGRRAAPPVAPGRAPRDARRVRALRPPGDGERAVGINCVDVLGGATLAVDATSIVNATGLGRRPAPHGADPPAPRSLSFAKARI